jgi:hypothetical protein
MCYLDRTFLMLLTLDGLRLDPGHRAAYVVVIAAVAYAYADRVIASIDVLQQEALP